MVIVPGAVAAQDEIVPVTYAKIPFAIIGSGLDLFAGIWTSLDTELEIGMPWLSDVVADVAVWRAGPLAWAVDMVAWGVGLVGDVLGAADTLLENMDVDLGFSLGDIKAITDTIACGLITPWAEVTGGEFAPCG
jgi:hypothetical protein